MERAVCEMDLKRSRRDCEVIFLKGSKAILIRTHMPNVMCMQGCIGGGAGLSRKWNRTNLRWIAMPSREISETEILPVENGVAEDRKQAPAESFRCKVIQSFALYFGFICWGLIFGTNGTTFLDLEILTGATTDQITFTFVGSSIAAFLSAIFAGAVISKFNPWLLLASDVFLTAIFHTAIPWSRSIVTLAAFHALRGFCMSFYNTGGNITLLSIWGKDNGPWMQALHFLFGIGGLLGPLTAKPFMYVEDEEDLNATMFLGNTSLTNFTASPRREEIDLAEMKIWIAYLIVGSLITCGSFALFGVYLAGDRKFKQIRKEEERKKKESSITEEKCFKFTIVGSIFFISLTYGIVEISCINFLVVWLVKHVGISKSKAALMMAAFWASFTVGRGLGIFITMILRPQILLALSVFGTLLFVAPQPFALLYPEWVLWLLIIGIGISLSTIQATLITWSERYIKVEGLVGATFMIGGELGDMAGPLFIGILFKTYGPGSLAVFLFAVSVVTVSTFCIAQFIAWRHGERDRDETKDTDRGGRDCQERQTGEKENQEHTEMLPVLEETEKLES